jgi:mRNA interferase MazF
MYSFGSIVLTRFPFTDLSASKVRPALVISRNNHRRFITSNVTAAPADALAMQPTRQNGLKAPSLVGFDKIATLEVQIIAGKIGEAEGDFLATAAKIFFGVFGFRTR